jgi:L-alanine-DL-glutamate epimerase-like enolase superfamily enzyme
MIDYVFKSGNRGIASEAIAGLDVALWDLKAKANGEPLYRTLEAVDPKVKAYASDIGLSLSDDELRAFYKSMAELGISAGKLKVGLDQERDMSRLAIMQEALATTGRKAELAIDSNEYWSPKEAIRRILEIEESFDLMWAEEPAGRWNPRGLKKVSQSIKAAVASGENLKDVPEYVPHMTAGSMDIVQLGNYTSGITGAQHVAHLAYAFELPVSVMNTPGNFMGHFAASLPNHLMIEIVNAGLDVGFTVDHQIVDGYLIPGDSPGLGLAFDAEVMEQLERQEGAKPARLVMPGRREGAGVRVVPLREAAADRE